MKYLKISEDFLLGLIRGCELNKNLHKDSNLPNVLIENQACIDVVREIIGHAENLETEPTSDIITRITPREAEYLLRIRDELVKEDINEAYHWLYQIDDPQFEKMGDEMWKGLEKLAGREIKIDAE